MDELRALRWVTLWLAIAPSALGCVDAPPECYEAEYRACECGEADGYQVCNAGVYKACVCDGTTPGLTTTTEPTTMTMSGTGGADLLGFMEPCNEDDECETMLCFLFTAKGKFCTTTCGKDGECPPPSPGCSMKGVCKAP
jgi:hypothetical protein